VIRWACEEKDLGKSFDHKIWLSVAKSGSLEVLEYLLQKCPHISTDFITSAFIYHDRLEMLEYCVSKGFPVVPQIELNSKGYLTLELLQFLLPHLDRNRYKEQLLYITTSVLPPADVDLWKFFISLDVLPTSKSVMQTIYFTNSFTLETLRFLVEDCNLPLPSGAPRLNSTRMRKDVKSYLIEKGVPGIKF
jgi:hypothetical protein